MNNNKSKQLLLSIIGVMVLVVAVAGVSYAFFTYSRTGASNNVITAGKISFVFTDGDFINLTNHFPISTSTGVALSGTDQTCTFTVTANTVSGATINYAVWAVPGDAASGVAAIDGTQFTSKFADSEVFVNIQSTASDTTHTAFSPAMTASQGKAISTLSTSASNGAAAPTNGKLLGTGTFTGTGANLTRSFTVRMWVDSSVVYVDDTTGTHHYTADAYSHLYYTMKIAVTAVQ